MKVLPRPVTSDLERSSVRALFPSLAAHLVTLQVHTKHESPGSASHHKDGKHTASQSVGNPTFILFVLFCLTLHNPLSRYRPISVALHLQPISRSHLLETLSMKTFTGLLSLPASLVAFVLIHNAGASDQQWPYNLPRSEKYYPEQESHIKRDLEAQKRFLREPPSAVRKMGDEAGDKFLLEYWIWDEMEPAFSSAGAETEHYANSSTISPVLPGLMPHSSPRRQGFNLFGRTIFARDFECPSGTKSCSSIDSDLCCKDSETCVNTSEGAGCCPNGATCGDDVAGCDTDAGFTSCPEGDGCCLPGAKCLDTGCVFYGTEIVTATSPTTTVVQSPKSSTPTAGATTIVSGYTTTATVTISGEDRTETTTIVSPTTVIIVPSTSASSCRSGFFSCASSLGGGCCRDGQNCASNSCEDNTSTSTSTSTATAAPPIRPTTSGTSISAANTEITTTTAVTSSSAAGCPTGFYMCSAVYLGGCCRVDRNCDTTSCPASETTAVVTGNGVSVGVAGPATGGSCASGWMSCAASVGGGCCPTGYSCGASCIATVSGAGDTSKIAPESSAVMERVLKVGFLGLAVLAGLGMVVL